VLSACLSSNSFIRGHSPQRAFRTLGGQVRIAVSPTPGVAPFPGKLRWKNPYIVSDVGFGFRLATGSVFNFSIHTGLAGAITLLTFTLPRFWPCYRSLKSFLFKVRPFVLEGYSSQPSAPLELSSERLDGAPPKGFSLEVRPFVLKGHSLSTFCPCGAIQLTIRRRTNSNVPPGSQR
jgi:hypothetical protein